MCMSVCVCVCVCACVLAREAWKAHPLSYGAAVGFPRSGLWRSIPPSGRAGMGCPRRLSTVPGRTAESRAAVSDTESCVATEKLKPPREAEGEPRSQGGKEAKRGRAQRGAHPEERTRWGCRASCEGVRDRHGKGDPERHMRERVKPSGLPGTHASKQCPSRRWPPSWLRARAVRGVRAPGGPTRRRHRSLVTSPPKPGHIPGAACWQPAVPAQPPPHPPRQGRRRGTQEDIRRTPRFFLAFLSPLLRFAL